MGLRLTLYLFLILVFSGSISYGQVQPLSRADSGKLQSYEERYEQKLSESDFKEASRYLNEIAFLFWNHNQYETATQYYEKSLDLNSNIDNENGIAMIYNNLGMLYADLNRYEESLGAFTKTLATRRANNEKIGIISALINRSVVLNNLKEYDASITDLQEALTLAREMNDIAQMKSIYGMLSETYEKSGAVDESLKYFELYRSFHEKIQKEEVSEIQGKLNEESIARQLAIAEKQAKELEVLKKQLEIQEKEKALQEVDSLAKSLYKDLSRKEIELRLVEQDAQLKEQQAKIILDRNESLQAQQRLLWGIGITILIALLLIGVIFYISNQRITKKNQLLQESNQALEDQKAALAESNEVKNKLFSIIAHDLRSPMNSLQSIFYIIDEHEQDGPMKKAYSELKFQLANVSLLLNNLLSWSRSQMDQLKPHKELIDLTSIVDENIALLSPLAQSKKIKVSNHISGTLNANADPNMMNIVLRNIIQNGIKFTRSEGHVEVSGQYVNGHVKIHIKDTGIGMDADQCAKLFEPKLNGSTYGTNNEQGTGLGLYICAEMIRKNNGDIKVDSATGKGSTFTISLSKS